MKLYRLVKNEVLKIVQKKRLLFISAILLVLILLFAYGEQYTSNKNAQRLEARIGTSQSGDWRKITEQQILNDKAHLDSPYMTENRKASIQVRIAQLEYNLKHNINPITPGSAKFTRTFMEQAIFLFLPLMIVILAGDLVSSEFAGGTIKLLLTKSVPRWKILLSKLIALFMATTIVILLIAGISAIASSFFFGYGGWDAPVTAGFKVINGNLDVSGVINVPQWQYIIMEYSLAWFVALAVASLSFMVSVLVRSTSASIGIMLSSLIGGSFLSFFLSDWENIRYLFNVNLQLTDYLSGSVQPLEGMTLGFSMAVLGVWAILALIVSFSVFIKRDVLV
jgi:ABC-2 type transport system permease protein